MKDEDVIKAVRDINADIYEQTQSEYICMEYRSDGMTNAVMFLGQCLWNDDYDMREYIDDGHTQESLLHFLKREGRSEIEKLTILWSNVIEHRFPPDNPAFQKALANNDQPWPGFGASPLFGDFLG